MKFKGTTVTILSRGLLLCLIWCSFTDATHTFNILKHCNKSISMIQWERSTLRLQLEPTTPTPPRVCTVKVRGLNQNYAHLLFFFRNLNLGRGDNCSTSGLHVFDGPDVSSPHVEGLSENICGTTRSGIFYSTGSVLTFQYVTDGETGNNTFDLTVTSYHTGQCYDDEHRCSGDRCIDGFIACTGDNPCGDNSDCDKDGSFMEILLPIIIVASVTVTAIVTLLYVKHRRRYVVPHTLILNGDTEKSPSRKVFKKPKRYGSGVIGETF